MVLTRTFQLDCGIRRKICRFSLTKARECNFVASCHKKIRTSLQGCLIFFVSIKPAPFPSRFSQPTGMFGLIFITLSLILGFPVHLQSVVVPRNQMEREVAINQNGQKSEPQNLSLTRTKELLQTLIQQLKNQQENLNQALKIITQSLEQSRKQIEMIEEELKSIPKKMSSEGEIKK